MDGFEVLKKIKRDENLKSMPVVVVTSSNYPKDVNEAYKNNVIYYVNKPIDFKRVNKILHYIEA